MRRHAIELKCLKLFVEFNTLDQFIENYKGDMGCEIINYMES